jgi:hypothetical protein
MVELTTAWAQVRDITAVINHEGMQGPSFARASHNVAIAVALLDTLRVPSADGVDKVYTNRRTSLASPRHRKWKAPFGARLGPQSQALVDLRLTDIRLS